MYQYCCVFLYLGLMLSYAETEEDSDENHGEDSAEVKYMEQVKCVLSSDLPKSQWKWLKESSADVYERWIFSDFAKFDEIECAKNCRDKHSSYTIAMAIRVQSGYYKLGCYCFTGKGDAIPDSIPQNRMLNPSKCFYKCRLFILGERWCIRGKGFHGALIMKRSNDEQPERTPVVFTLPENVTMPGSFPIKTAEYITHAWTEAPVTEESPTPKDTAGSEDSDSSPHKAGPSAAALGGGIAGGLVLCMAGIAVTILVLMTKRRRKCKNKNLKNRNGIANPEYEVPLSDIWIGANGSGNLGHGADNLGQGAGNVSQSAGNLGHGAENLSQGAANLDQGAENIGHGAASSSQDIDSLYAHPDRTRRHDDVEIVDNVIYTYTAQSQDDDDVTIVDNYVYSKRK